MTFSLEGSCFIIFSLVAPLIRSLITECTCHCFSSEES